MDEISRNPICPMKAIRTSRTISAAEEARELRKDSQVAYHEPAQIEKRSRQFEEQKDGSVKSTERSLTLQSISSFLFQGFVPFLVID